MVESDGASVGRSEVDTMGVRTYLGSRQKNNDDTPQS